MEITHVRMSIASQLREVSGRPGMGVHTTDAASTPDGRFVYVINGEELTAGEMADRYLGGWNAAYGRSRVEFEAWLAAQQSE